VSVRGEDAMRTRLDAAFGTMRTEGARDHDHGGDGVVISIRKLRSTKPTPPTALKLGSSEFVVKSIGGAGEVGGVFIDTRLPH